MTFRRVLHILYAIGFTAVAVIFVTGLPYYQLPLTERPHAELHTAFKPGGTWGHGVGIVGSTMVLLLLLYSARKRRWMGLSMGRLSRWLDVHILFGVIGPLLITLHTAGKLGGIVSISYFSMMAVALSGVFGRYLYMQIPRDARGHALGIERARARAAEIGESLRTEHHLPDDVVAGVQRFVAMSSTNANGLRAVFATIGHDLRMRGRVRRLRRFMRQGQGEIPEAAIDEIVGLAREQSLLQRRIAVLESTARLFHHWHVFHKPFAIIMIVIMFVHVGVTLAFGYRWIF
ncbi:MAG TPA: hypothetical protein ENO19_00295 [Halothiobacillaceae bacterium]|nr:hypothetical protein [Halothiobacillaceae bacterium]